MLYIYTSAVNNPKFIEMQDMTLKKFIKNDYVFTVYNDAKSWEDFSNHYNPNIKAEIRKTCENLNIKCIDIPNDHHVNLTGGTERTADSCNFMLKDQLNINDHTLLLDSDMFVINDIDVIEKYKGYEMAIVPQKRQNAIAVPNSDNPYKLIDVNYIWNGLFYFNMPIVKNKHLLNWNALGGKGGITDTGGEMFHYLNGTPNLKAYKINHLSSCCWSKEDFPQKLNPVLFEFLDNDIKNTNNGKYWAEIYDETFLHYRAGGNWENLPKDTHQNRTNILYNTLVKLVKE